MEEEEMIFALTLISVVRNIVLLLSSFRPRRDGLFVRFMRALHESRRIMAEREIAKYRHLIAPEQELRELKSTLAHDQRAPAVKHDASFEPQALRLVKR